MNAKQKKLWVKALRSGEYKQCKGRLKRTVRAGQYQYCCLGVAKELFGLKKSPNSNRLREDFLHLGVQRTLWGKNDISGYSFPEIADYIEEHL